MRASVFADLAPHIEAHTRAGGELIALHIGDTYREPPPAARFAAADPPRFDPTLYGYGGVHGTSPLRSACAQMLRDKGRAFSPMDPDREVLITSGATHAIYCAARALFDPGDEVLLASPYWPLAHGVLIAAGAHPVEVSLSSSSGLNREREPSLDAGALFEQAIRHRTRGIYLITPNNPDGKVLSPEALASIARVARAHDLWVIADEVYADYTYGVDHVSMASLEGMKERTISVYSFSKSHALAGARIGFMVAPERVIALGRRVATHTVFNVPVIAQRIACAAIATGDSWILDAKREYRLARDAAVERLRGAPVRFAVPEGGNYLFLDFSEWLGDRPLKILLERAISHGVLLAPGDACGAGFEACARLCFTAVSKPKMLEGIDRLLAAMQSLG